MATTFDDIVTLIPNATMKKRYVDGVFKSYNITPNEGYVLFDTARDYSEVEKSVDDNGNEIEIDVHRKGYGKGMSSCGYDYEFTPVQIEINGNAVTAYGSREFAAVPENLTK